jgi:hypothetical protein
MKIRIDNLTAVPALRRYLGERKDFVVQEREPGTIAVGVLGSLRDGGLVEVERYLRPWRERNDDVKIYVFPDA